MRQLNSDARKFVLGFAACLKQSATECLMGVVNALILQSQRPCYPPRPGRSCAQQARPLELPVGKHVKLPSCCALTTAWRTIHAISGKRESGHLRGSAN